jgi:two-component system response regulator FixJ
MAMSRERRVYVVDDDEAVRDSLVTMLGTAAFAVRSWASAVEFIAGAATLPGGCVVADLRMPGMDGLELQAQLNERRIALPLIMMTAHADVALAVRAMRAGAVDFIEKPFTAEAIMHSLELGFARLASEAGRAVPAAIAERLASLSSREREVLELLVAGLPNKAIAHRLAISPRTVEIHRAKVMGKMQARSLSELVRFALSAGIGEGVPEGC